MNLEKITQISQEEAEKGIIFLRNGLPEESVPIQGNNFLGYYSLTREIGEKKMRLVYEPNGKSFLFRNASYLE